MTITELSPFEVLKAVQEGSMFVDVREAYELDEISYDIDRLKHVPLGEIQLKMHEFPKDCEIIIGCRSGKRSMNACLFLAMNGFTQVKNLKGGIIGWTEAGMPTK